MEVIRNNYSINDGQAVLYHKILDGLTGRFGHEMVMGGGALDDHAQSDQR
jgi:long-subunit acyl-CoA synthetase (AMP-forming)